MLALTLAVLVYLALFAGLIWLILAAMSVRWRSWRPVRSAYLGLLMAILLGIARWLWSPEFPREGGGQVARARLLMEDEEELWD